MRSLLVCASLIVALSACGRESEQERDARAFEKELEWVETANPARSFEADTSSGRFHFLSVCGVTCMIPGVSRLNAEKCYPEILVEKMRGTGDVIFTERQQQLQARVWEYSRDYNLMVASSERAKGRSTCEGEENWDEGFFAISKALQSLTGANGVRSERLVTIAKNSKTFEIVLPRDIPMKPFKDKTCAVLAEHGLSRAAKVRYRIDQNEKGTWQEILCSARNAA
jgi:hypothetical protein